MFYEDATKHGLAFDPFKAIVAPRPIGWISTVDHSGRANLAPFSFFNAFAARPHLIGFSSDGWKATVRNAVDAGEFVFNLSTLMLIDAMNRSAAKVGVNDDKIGFAGVDMVRSLRIAPPRVAASPASLECTVVEHLELKDCDGRPTNHHLVIGQVVGTHIRDEFIVDGRFDAVKAQTIARCGYRDYAVVSSVFEVARPQ
jgi:flavin reductase (DIM6/NTAB) family NADH-FMN oxidoreductase RutF